ncbi:lipopolysaccharide biosynthesis protein [Streptococcus sp. IsoGale021]|uniref:lipopolysaccharide biosynthesis protein n=1 Tax=Streptococcus TaxID=1301 RepID=UPI002000DEA5|nr:MULTISPECIES: lipopolysaccharide biosynthesis protein [Streptococcus]MCY7211416.1 oligosaccharide flippase family protein [Streptococcus anginosus]MDQ8693898.1 lipopolysaccharide biosynthesis protein [Streptococcus sp. IsoGale021]MDU5128326.1 lipopolysaccharide biosynthesis protein [Streptococcus anginosus]MEE0847651.1 lipopolysaccharide biosynthesis protein [Streptococcus anginosus]
MKNSKKNVIKGLFWTLSERFMSQIVSVIVTVILTRLLAPEDYGVVSVVTVIITILNVFMTSGFSASLIQQEDVEQIDYSTVLYFSILLGFLLYIGVVAISPMLATFYSLPQLELVLKILALKIPLSALNSVQQAYVSRNMLFKKFFISTVTATIVSGGIGVIMAYTNFGVWALVAQDLSNVITISVVLWFSVGWRPTFQFSFTRLKILFDFGVKIFVQTLFNTIYANIRSLLIGGFYSPTDLAYYTKGNQYPNLIVTNVDTAVSKTMFPVMSREQEDLTRIKLLARRTAQVSSYIMSPILVGFFVCAEQIVSVVMTNKWLPAVPYIRIICICLLIRASQTAILQAIKSIGRSDVVLKMDIPVRILALFILMITIRFGVIYIAVSEIIIEFLALLIYSYYSSRLLNYGYLEIFGDFLKNVALSVIMGGMVYFLGSISSFSSLATLIIQIFLGGIIYILLSIFLKNESWALFISVIRKN